MTREMTDKTIETAGLGFPIPSVEMYVPSLARHLTLDPAAERKLLDNASLDIQAWAQAVQWAPGDSRVVTARLERNQKPPVFLRSDSPLPRQIDEQTSVEQALSALTLYRAKLEFLRENAPHDVTKPLFRLDLEAAKVDKQIKSILGDGSVKNASQLSSVSLRDVLKDYVPTKKKAVLALTAGALAACTLKTPEAINPSPTAPVVSELVPTEELEQQMIDSFDLNGQDLKVKISTPDGVREDLPISDIERVITVSDLDDPVYSEVSIAQMRLKDQEAAAIEFWVFSRKDGQAPDSQFVIWTPVGADASGVRLNAVKLAVDDNNVAGVPQNPEIVGNALVPGDPSQPIDITIYKPNQKDQNFHFDLGQALFRSIDSILAWDAQVAEASGEATQISVSPTAVIDALASQTAASPETSTQAATAIAQATATVEASTTPEPTNSPEPEIDLGNWFQEQMEREDFSSVYEKVQVDSQNTSFKLTFLINEKTLKKNWVLVGSDPEVVVDYFQRTSYSRNTHAQTGVGTWDEYYQTLEDGASLNLPDFSAYNVRTGILTHFENRSYKNLIINVTSQNPRVDGETDPGIFLRFQDGSQADLWWDYAYDETQPDNLYVIVQMNPQQFNRAGWATSEPFAIMNAISHAGSGLLLTDKEWNTNSASFSQGRKGLDYYSTVISRVQSLMNILIINDERFALEFRWR